MSLFKSTVLVSFFTFLSRITGFVRDTLTAIFFGTGVWTDAFVVVFKIPNFFRRIFAEGSFSLAFVPVLNEIKTNGTKEELKHFIDHVTGSLIAALLIVFGVMQLFAPAILSLFSWPEDQPEVFEKSVDMFRFTLFYLPTISLVALCGGILNSFNKFAVPAATPILLNLSLILMLLFARDKFEVEIESLAVGVLIAGFAQLLFQVPALIRLGMLPFAKFDLKNKKVKKVINLMLPTIFGSSIAQINLFLDTLIATFLPLVGSVSFLYFSDRLLEFPLGIFAIAISTVILPSLSRNFAKDDKKEFTHTLKWAMNLAFAIAIPSAIGLMVLAKEVIFTLFEYKNFNAMSTYYTSLSLMAYMLALPAFVMNKVLMPAFFARKDAKTPVRIAVICMIVNMVMNLVFVFALWALEFTALHVGLALASAVSGWLQTYLLYTTIVKQKFVVGSILDWVIFTKIILAGLVMGIFVFLITQQVSMENAEHWYERLGYLLMFITTGFITYLTSLWVFKMHPKKLLSLK